jgi:hypothetical protein
VHRSWVQIPPGNSRSSREAPGADQEGYEWSEAPREKVPVWGSAGYTGRSTGEHQCGIENTNVRAYPPVEIALALADPLPADRRLQGRSRLWEISGCVSVTGLLPPPCRQAAHPPTAGFPGRGSKSCGGRRAQQGHQRGDREPWRGRAWRHARAPTADERPGWANRSIRRPVSSRAAT